MKIQDEKVVDYIKNYIYYELVKIPEVSKVFSAESIKSKLEKNIKNVYVIEDGKIEKSKLLLDSSMVIESIKAENITIDDIQNDEIMQHTIIHEGIHAITKKAEIELENERQFKVGTLKYTYNKNTKSVEETGRYFNEGLTEWIISKSPKNNNGKAYDSMKQYINIIEKFIGSESVATFLNGEYDQIFEKLNMNQQQGKQLFLEMDRVYKMEQYMVALKPMQNYLAFRLSKENNVHLLDLEFLNSVIEHYEKMVKETEMYKKLKLNEDECNIDVVYNEFKTKYMEPVEKGLQNCKANVLYELISSLAIDKVKSLDANETQEFLKIHNAIYDLKYNIEDWKIDNNEKLNLKLLEFDDLEVKFMKNTQEILIDKNGLPINVEVNKGKSLAVKKEGVWSRITNYLKRKIINVIIKDEERDASDNIDKKVLDKYTNEFIGRLKVHRKWLYVL